MSEQRHQENIGNYFQDELMFVINQEIVAREIGNRFEYGERDGIYTEIFDFFTIMAELSEETNLSIPLKNQNILMTDYSSIFMQYKQNNLGEH